MRGVNLKEEKEKFVLYEYLLYFWKKKWLFLIIPLITTLLVASAIYALKHTYKYTGTALIFTGSVNSKDLTDPNNIKAKFKNIKNLEVYVSEKGQVKFTLNGNSKEQIQKDLDTITNRFSKELNANADIRLDSTSDSVKNLQNLIKEKKAALKVYQQMLDSNHLSINEYNNIVDIVIISEDELSGAQTRINEMKADIATFEKPKVLSESVYPKKTYLPESVAIGIVLGVLLTIALLIFLKYLEDARKYYKQR
jgi:hypothetical protein